MASMYDIKIVEYLEVPYVEYMNLTGTSTDTSLQDASNAWKRFSEKYKDINWSSLSKASADVVMFTGPRSSLLELKYDLEKKRYG